MTRTGQSKTNIPTDICALSQTQIEIKKSSKQSKFPSVK